MGNFQGGGNRGGGFGGGNRGGKPSFQKKSFGDRGPRDSRDAVSLHKATCAECGNVCEVPFRPNGDKPVFCNNCFSSKREGGDNRGPRRDFTDRTSAPRREFNDRSSGSSFARQVPALDETKRHLAEMNMKLDRLISAMEKMSPIKSEAKVYVKNISEKKSEEKSAPIFKIVAKKSGLKPKPTKASAKKVSAKKKR